MFASLFWDSAYLPPLPPYFNFYLLCSSSNLPGTPFWEILFGKAFLGMPPLGSLFGKAFLAMPPLRSLFGKAFLAMHPLRSLFGKASLAKLEQLHIYSTSLSVRTCSCTSTPHLYLWGRAYPINMGTEDKANWSKQAHRVLNMLITITLARAHTNSETSRHQHDIDTRPHTTHRCSYTTTVT